MSETFAVKRALGHPDPRMLVGQGYGGFEYQKIVSSEGDYAIWIFDTQLGRKAFIKDYGGVVTEYSFTPPAPPKPADPPQYFYGAGVPTVVDDPPGDPDANLKCVHGLPPLHCDANWVKRFTDAGIDPKDVAVLVAAQKLAKDVESRLVCDTTPGALNRADSLAVFGFWVEPTGSDG